MFHKAEVQYSYLSDWGELPGIKKERDYQDNNKLKELRLTYTVAENIEVTTKDAKISVFYGGREAGERESIDLKQYVSLIIEQNKELPFQDLNSKFQDFRSKFIGPLQDFITFATDRANSITELKLYSYYGDADVDIEKIPYTIEQLPIKALYKTNYPDIKEQNRLLYKHEILFSISDIDNLSSTLERWFDSRKELDSTFNLFFSIRYKPDMYLENKFVNLVQAAESYHRRKYNRRTDKTNLPDDECEKKRLAVLDCLDNLTNEEYKKWAKDKFENDGLTLKQRLIDLTKLIPYVTNQLIGVDNFGYDLYFLEVAKLLNKEYFRLLNFYFHTLIQQINEIQQINDKNKNFFCAKITTTRNDFIHDKKKKNPKSAKLEQLPDLIESLSFILQACFLMELGFDSKECYQLLNRNIRYQYTVERVRKNKYFDCPKENL